MRCAVCSGPLLYDRIENESRCLICGRAPQKRQSARRPEERKREEYPRRYNVGDDQADTGTKDVGANRMLMAES